jgi:O-antigen ligase
VLAVLFFQSSMSGKFRIVLGSLVFAVVSAALLPTQLLNRYLSVLGNDSAEQNLSSGAIGSVEGRKYLLTQSLYVTAKHPLTGVGLGMFMEAEDTIARDEGLLHGAWHETHNMYTQVSSEAGLPALFFFIGALVYGFKNLNFVCRAAKRSRDPVIRDAGTLAFWMRLALLGLASTGFFLSVAYAVEPLILLAMTVSLERAVRIKMAAAPAIARAPAEAPRAPASVRVGRYVNFSSRAVANRAGSKERVQPLAFSSVRKPSGSS